MKELSLYVHIPFCASRCDYCSFFSSLLKEDVQKEYVSALKKEIERYSSPCKDYLVKTVYIGGGTPSCLYTGAVKEISDCIKNNFNTDFVEFTAEANPSSFSDDKIKEYLSAGINRVSLGVQSLNKKSLDAVSRKEDPESIIPLLKKAVKAFSSVSADLMIGLPFSSEEGLLSDAKELISSGIDHISAYALSIEEGTSLEKNVKNGRVALPDEDEQANAYNTLYSFLKENGFERYEVSNFCKDGKFSRHNTAYWTGKEYLGLGAGAHGYFKDIRYNNIYDIKGYINNLSNGKSVDENRVLIDEGEKEKERIMFGLRMAEGIAKTQDLLDKINASPYKKCFLTENGRIKIKDEYFYVMNALICELI